MTFGTSDNGALHPLEIDIPGVEIALTDPDVQIVDCREQEEWDQAHLSGTTLMPLGEMEIRIGELDRTRPVIIVCRSGNRSLVAAELLTNAGFQDAKSLAGGLIGWAESGRSLVR